MDIFATSVTAITEIYNITVFIQGVVDDIKSYDSDRHEIQIKLEHERLFLDSFRGLFFDDDALMRSNQIHTRLKRNVHDILTELNKAIMEYGVLAAKHGFWNPKNEKWIEESSGQSVAPSFRNRVKLKMKDLTRPLDWALFDKEKIKITLAKYSEWVGMLRQTTSFVLLSITSFQDPALNNFAKSKNVRDMGLQEVIERQILARTEPPDDFGGLDGCIIESSESASGSNIILAKYENDWGCVQEVVVEYREYSRDLVQATKFNLAELERLKAPIRRLAWLLHGSSFFHGQYDVADPSNQLSVYTLRCLGYIDQPEYYRSTFIYQIPPPRTLPTRTEILSLHDWINIVDAPISKPSLGDRFFLAHALALTILNIHGSGWVHKNIWSRGISVFPNTRFSFPSESQRVVPYLTGWGFARPILGDTELLADMEVEPNFYRHPLRQGHPEADYVVEHDIYALGVVLLEIGLWETVDSIFKKQINQAITKKHLLPPWEVRDALVEKTRTRIAIEMGNSYAISVEKCLKGEFGLGEDDENKTGLLAVFREMVVDIIAKGMRL